MSLSEDCLYHAEHAWVKQAGGDEVLIGVSHFAQDTLGDIVEVSYPMVGSSIAYGAPCGTLESRKTVSDLIAPISGVVIEINRTLNSEPFWINDDPHGKGWIARVRMADPEELKNLVGLDKYKLIIGI